MSQPAQKERNDLAKLEGDDEAYHGMFDKLLEAKLMALDPEWMDAMTILYAKSKMNRWCA